MLYCFGIALARKWIIKIWRIPCLSQLKE
jgi:hypothetical protein